MSGRKHSSTDYVRPLPRPADHFGLTPVVAPELAIELLPAIARQATSAVVDASATHVAARVVADALDLLGVPAQIVAVEVAAWRRGDTERSCAHSFGTDGTPYYAVETADVLVDACLDLFSTLGGGLQLRPSWFSLPANWRAAGAGTFEQDQRGSVVAYRRLGAAVPKPESELLALRLATHVVDLCQQAASALAGVERAPRRWTSVPEAA